MSAKKKGKRPFAKTALTPTNSQNEKAAGKFSVARVRSFASGYGKLSDHIDRDGGEHLIHWR